MNPGKRLRGVLFDWDGTLLDSFHADSQAYLAMFRDLGLTWGLAELRKHYSPDWYTVYRRAGIARELWDDADRLWRAYYAKHPSKLIPATRRVLTRLSRHHKLGLVTSDTPEKKPHPAPLRLALRRMKLAPADCVYVGDTPEDLEMAKAAGVQAVAVLGPFPTAHRLRAARPEYLLKDLDELPALLRKIDANAVR